MKLHRELKHKSEDIQDAVLMDVVGAIRRRVRISDRPWRGLWRLAPLGCRRRPIIARSIQHSDHGLLSTAGTAGPQPPSPRSF